MVSTITIIDTEYQTHDNAREENWGLPGMHREVFQIAAIQLIKGQPWSQGATFERLAKLVVTGPLTEASTRLTGVTQARLDAEGIALEKALQEYAVFAGETLSISNGQDINPIAESCGIQRFAMPLDPRRFTSLRGPLYAALHAEVGDFNRKDYPSGRVYELLNIKLNTSQVHNALHDVYSLAATCQELERRGHKVLPW